MQRLGFKPLETRRLSAGARPHRPTLHAVRADSPALEVMTDLDRVPAATVSPDVSLDRATDIMIVRGVRLLFVTDADGALLGLITSRDTLGERPMQVLNGRGVSRRELTVADLMRKVEEVDVVDWHDVELACVGDIVTTLHRLGRQHLLVGTRDPQSGRQHVRGIFSVTQIGRQLGVPVQTFEVASTFAEIEAALLH
jgi:signal-transduction protein with cAMP-binding, CBS, and nucleotidyltransferase domain